ncbi:conjugal transfer protein [Virgibacillus salexigens]|uniref:conjugal transfer protein n=1 Tax=Virgibacillus massiliensis TaxID=1462526 RepID=UPI00136A6772|nr:conjugal transfer protein [Virgibacillus massiliensis]
MKGLKNFFNKKSRNVSSKKNVKPKKEKLTREIAFSREKVRKIISLTVFSIICLSLLFNIIFFSKYQSIKNSVQASESHIEDELNQVEEGDVGYSDSVIPFTEDFLTAYYNIPRENEKRDQRLETLNNYFVSGFDTTTLETIEDFKGDRKINSLRYIETEQLGNNKMNVHFDVSYEITEIEIVEEEVEKEVKDDKDKDKKKKVTEVVEKEKPKTIKDSVEIVVPVVTNGQGYAVADNPSLTSRDLTANIKDQNDSIEGEDVSTTERENIKSFLNEFFTSYGTSDEKLPFMANVEKGLTGKILSSATIQDVAVNNEGDYQIIADVVYQNEETSFNSTYTYYLIASKEKNSYFIDEIKQGGF